MDVRTLDSYQIQYPNERSFSDLDPINPTIQTILGHKSTRSFKSDLVSPNTVEITITVGRSAYTCSGLQTWSTVVV